MNYTIEIQQVGRNGVPLKPLQIFGTDTQVEAINLARKEFASALPEVYPLSAVIFDKNRQMILSYTGASPKIDD